MTVNNSQATRIDSSSEPARANPATSSAEVASALSPMVSRLARKTDTRATRSENLVLRKPGAGNSCPHIRLSAARNRCTHSSPTYSAAARPITPTEVREAMAASIRAMICSPNSPGTAAFTRVSISSSCRGRWARAKPTTAKPTISSGKIANRVK